jgi:hypothetical protein
VVTGQTGQSVGPVHMLGTSLTGGGDRSDWCKLKLLHLPCCQVVCMHSSRGGALVQGELARVQGELFVVVRVLVWWFALFA